MVRSLPRADLVVFNFFTKVAFIGAVSLSLILSRLSLLTVFLTLALSGTTCLTPGIFYRVVAD